MHICHYFFLNYSMTHMYKLNSYQSVNAKTNLNVFKHVLQLHVFHETPISIKKVLMPLFQLDMHNKHIGIFKSSNQTHAKKIDFEHMISYQKECICANMLACSKNNIFEISMNNLHLCICNKMCEFVIYELFLCQYCACTDLRAT